MLRGGGPAWCHPLTRPLSQHSPDHSSVAFPAVVEAAQGMAVAVAAQGRVVAVAALDPAAVAAAALGQ